MRSAYAVTFPFLLTAFGVTAMAASGEDFWPAWRGPQANGTALKGNPPVTWSETENVKWKVACARQGTVLSGHLGQPDLLPDGDRYRTARYA